MKKKTSLLTLGLLVLSTSALVGCNGNGGGEDNSTAAIVKKAGSMTLTELEAAAKAEMDAADSKFKIVGLTSTLSKAAANFEKQYEWIKDKWACNNSYKDYTLLTALEAAEDNYFADFALVQDARSLSDYLEDGITVNYVPKDYAELGLKEKDTYPLKGIHFNKIFFSNKHMDASGNDGGVNLYNVWQLSGSSKDTGHISNLSFQSPVTEQINMSFLLSLYSEDGISRLTSSYKEFYGKDWAASEDYSNISDEYVKNFIANITTYHSSDGTAMKETQAKETDPSKATLYYGAYAKMKDAAAKYYDVEYPDGHSLSTKDANGVAYDSKNNNLDPTKSAMSTVKWDYEIKGFNGFMYTMYSQIVNHAKYPYTACLYARYLLTPDCYKAMCYNSSTVNKDGEKANMYGYYYPATISNTSTGVSDNDNDWTRDKWIANSINEDYDFLKNVKSGTLNTILTWVNSSK